uniref:BlCHR2 n=1 Tax=Bilabrum TaxID=2721177 RepID=UPI0024CC9479
MSECCELCVCQKEPGTFGALIAVNTITAIILVAAGAYMAWKTAAGLGWNTRPHGPEGPPEENWLSPGISILCGVMYAFKAIDWASYNDTGESTAFSLNQVWYSDYLITCPLLVLDFCITVNLRYKLVFSSSIACLLAIAVSTFIVDAPYRYYMYGIGLAGFICAGYALWNEINAQREKIPDSAWWYLSAGRLIFFAGWPFFPLLWTLSFHTSGVINEEWYFILHAILDILCKAVFGFFMLGFRLELEELDFKAIEAEQAKLEGDKEAQALKNDKDTGEVLRHYNRASSGFFGQGIPDDQGSVSGGSVLMSRARRQHMLYRREASYLSMDPMAEKIRELEMLKKKIQKEVDSRSKKMQREMTARFAIQDDSDDEDGGRGAGSARRRKNARRG